MVRVLVFGASGFIGKGVSETLVRAGHTVIGQTRDAGNTLNFRKSEIVPLVTDTATEDQWSELIPYLDAIVDTLGGNDGDQSMSRIRLAERVAAKTRPQYAARLTYIKTSGTWIQGSDPFDARSDGTVVSNEPQLVKWLLEQESELKSSKILNGIVIRPSMLIGGNGSLLAPLFAQAAQDKKIEWPGDQTTTFQSNHIDDLAECYRLTIEKAPLVAGLSIDCTNPAQESLSLLLHNLARLEGFSDRDIVSHPPSNPWEECLVTSRPLGQVWR